MNNVIHLPNRLTCRIVEQAIESRFPQFDRMSELMRRARIEGRLALQRRRSNGMSIEAGCQVVRRSQIIVIRRHGDAA